MSEVTTLGTLAVNDALPPGYRKAQHALDKKGIHALFQRLSQENPEAYADVFKKLSDIGKQAVWTEGVSVSLAALRKSKAKEAVLAPVRQKIQTLLDDDTLDDDTRRKSIIDAILPAVQPLQDAIMTEADAEGSPYASQINSGARGKRSDLNSLRGADLLATDSNDKFMPIPLLNSYAEGFTPAQYFAASYGQRKGAIGVKMATAEAGYLNKRLVNAVHRAIVTKDKADPTRLPVGLPVATGDMDNVGAVLAHDAGKLKAGHILRSEDLEDLKDDGVDEILLHSTMTEPSEDGGISAQAAGKRTRQGLHMIGDNIGISAAQALGERLSQGTLCLAKGTLVRMADWSVRAIENVHIGERVLGADRAGRTFPVSVVQVYDNGLRSCQRSTWRFPRLFKSFIDITCTPEHKVLAHSYYSSSEGEYHTEDIREIGRLSKLSGLVLSRGFDDRAAGCVDDWRARLFGTLLGGGCYTKSVSGVYLSCADLTQIVDLNAYLAPYGYYFRRLKHHKGVYYRFRSLTRSHSRSLRDSATGRITRSLPATPVVTWLTELGMYGKYAHEKSIPLSWISTWSNRSIAELIGGLFVTDGCVYKGADGVVGVSYGSTSLEMITQVRDLLCWRFGIYAAAISAQLGKRKRHMYMFTVTEIHSVQKFADCIPLFGVKRERMSRLVAEKTSSRKSYNWFRRVSVEDAGEVPTFDLEVDHPDHLFVLANGAIVSNSSKHAAGVNEKVSKSGMEYINRLIEAPDNFPEAGPLSETSGTVNAIRDAPQGGKYITVDKHDYYAPVGVDPIVKEGQQVEEGDDLTDGIPHPRDLIRLRGLGEARRVFTKHFKEALDNSGVGAHRRNVETVVGGLMNWARITAPDGIGDAVYDDVVPFNTVAHSYRPRANAVEKNLNIALGEYLEEPALHYTPGTKLTHKVTKELGKWGVKKAFTHPEPPDFAPEMVRGVHSVYNDPDWKTRLTGFYTASAFQKALHRGLESDTKSTSYAGAVAAPGVLGKNLGTIGKYGST